MYSKFGKNGDKITKAQMAGKKNEIVKLQHFIALSDAAFFKLRSASEIFEYKQ